MTPRVRGLTALIALLGGLLAAGNAAAFRLVPIEMELEPSGRGATQIFRVENDNRDAVAIEIKILARKMGMSGEDVLTETGDEFVVFPEQMILQPGENQSLRVQWVGDPKPERELPYRLIAEQLPIDIGKAPASGGQVRLLVRYVASLYIKPAGVKAAVSFVSAKQETTPQGPALAIVLRNDGNARQIMKEPTVTLTGGGKTVTLKAEQLAGLVGENLLGGTTRQFLIPVPAGLPAGALTGTIAFP